MSAEATAPEAPLGGPHPSWLTPVPDAQWPGADGDQRNPFLRWRRLLWSHHRALTAGWTDDDFVGVVTEIDAAISSVDGTGFTVTPTGEWSAPAPELPATVVWKDETGNVGGSHKARHLMGLLLHLAVDAVADDTHLAISSCGNAAIGAATVARAASRPIDVFIPTWADPVVVATLERLDASVRVCERRAGEDGDPCMHRFQEAVADGALPFGVQATENRWTLDGGRTIGWELAEALVTHPATDVFVQVGGGALLTSCAMGLIEAGAVGPLATVPRVWAVQSEGCAPFDRAWRALPDGPSIDARLEAASSADALMYPWADPHSAATGILDDVTYDWLGVARALLVTGGDSVVATEAEIVAAAELVPRLGIAADATGTASVAGAMAAQRHGDLDPAGAVGVLVTGVRR